MNPGKYKGCDVSEWNDVETTDITPYDFVIIRAGWSNTEDKLLDKWIAKCKELGKPYGLYWYSYATTTGWAEIEARMFCSIAARYHPTMGIWLDMEDADGYKAKKWGYLDPYLITSICETFLNITAETGLYTGVYASESWFGNLIQNTEIMSHYDKWVASWGTNNGQINRDTSEMGTLLQYTSKGGTEGHLDEDISYIDISIYDVKKDTEEDLKEKVKALEMEVARLRGILEKVREVLGDE